MYSIFLIIDLQCLLERNEQNSSEIEKTIEAKSIAFDLIKTDNLSLQNQIKFLEEENSNLSNFEENCEAKMVGYFLSVKH